MKKKIMAALLCGAMMCSLSACCVQHLEGGGQFQRHAPSGSHQRAYGQAGV